MSRLQLAFLLSWILGLNLWQPAHAAEPQRIRAMFLGDHGHHHPAERAADFIPAMKDVGIDITYTDQLNRLTPENLRHYDCLILYANHGAMSAEQEAALIGFVDVGGGFVPIHCASACFGKSAKYAALELKKGSELFN